MNLDELLEDKSIFFKIAGFWPEECKRAPIYSRLKMFGSYSCNLLIWVLQVVGVTMVATVNDMPDYFIDLCGFTTATAKISALIINRNQILWLLTETKKFEKIQKENPAELEIAQFWQSCRNRIGIYLARAYCFLGFSYFAAVFFFADKMLPLKLMFKPNSIHSPWFEMIYAVEFVVCSVVICTMLSSDIFFTVFICQLCEELQLIQLQVETSMKGDVKRMMSIIRRHVRILDYGEKVCGVVSVAFFSQYSSACLVACFGSFTAMTEQNSAAVNKSLGTTFVIIVSLLVICIAGEIVSTTSQDVANAITQSNLIFYNGESDNLVNLRNICFMLLRAQKSLKLSVGTFGMMNLQFFCSTMKMIYSFITLLRTMYV